MESRQREPKGSDQGEATGGRLLHRNIIISALKDLGLGDIREVFISREWRHSPAFRQCCDGADWDHEWIESVFCAVEDLHREHGAVRTKLTKDSVALLRKVARD